MEERKDANRTTSHSLLKNKIVKSIIVLFVILSKIGFCFADDSATFDSNATKAYIDARDGYANVRKGAGTNFELVASISNATKVDSYGSIKNSKNETWYYIICNSWNESISGWTHNSNISFDYKKFEKEELTEEVQYLQVGSLRIGLVFDNDAKKEKYLYKTIIREATTAYEKNGMALNDVFKFQTDIDEYESQGITEYYDEGEYDKYDKYESVTTFYDFEGNELGLEILNLKSYELYKNNLIYADYEGVKSYDIINKKIINLGDKYNTVTISNKEVILSLNDWWEKAKLCFYSLDLKNKYEFDGYKFNKEIPINGKKYKVIYRDIDLEFDLNSSGVYVYANLLDESYSKVFSEDIFVTTKGSRFNNYDEDDKNNYAELLKSNKDKKDTGDKNLEFNLNNVDKIYKLNDDDYNFEVKNENGYAIFNKDKIRISDYFKYDIERVHISDKQEYNVYLTANDKKERVYFKIIDGKTDKFFVSLKKKLDFSDYNYYIEYYPMLYIDEYEENDSRNKYKIKEVNSFTPTIIHNLDRKIKDIEIENYSKSLKKVYMFAGKPYFLLTMWYGTSVWINDLYDCNAEKFAGDATVVYNDDVILVRDKFGDNIHTYFYDKNMNLKNSEYAKQYTKISGYNNKVHRFDYQRTYSDWYDKDLNLKYEYQMHERSGFSGPIGDNNGKTYYYVQRSNDSRVNLNNGPIEGRIIDEDFNEYKVYHQIVFSINNMKKGDSVKYLVDFGKGSGYEILDEKFKSIEKSDKDLNEDLRNEILKKYKD